MVARRILLVLPLVFAALVAWWVWRPAPSASGPAAAQPPVTDASRSAVLPPDSSSDAAGRPEVAKARAALDAARDEHAEARAELDRVTRDMEELEEDVAELERYVQDLESRGEDPADHAFEGMERVRPVLERYQAIVGAWDRAQSEELRTRAALEEAERAVVDAEAGG